MVSLGSGPEEMGRDAAGRFGEVGPCLKGASFKADLLSCILKQWSSCDVRALVPGLSCWSGLQV